MVRLKVLNLMSNVQREIKFQFLMVRLKVFF